MITVTHRPWGCRQLILVAAMVSCLGTSTVLACQSINAERKGARFRYMIVTVAQRHNIDPDLVRALVKVESNFNPMAVSKTGARGLTQLMPGTQRDLKVRWVFDPHSNLDGGTRYLKSQLRRFRSVRKALWAYHAGPARVDKGTVPRKSRQYANRVLGYYWCFKREGM